MTVFGWMLLIAVIGGAAWLQYTISKSIQGPSHCIGCGQCSKTGICVLTGEPVGPRRKPFRLPDGEGQHGEEQQHE